MGSGSAGLLTAILIRNKNFNCKVTLIRDPDTKIIGVGESTVISFRYMLEEHCGINTLELVQRIKPTPKFGGLFEFGEKDFHYTFDQAFDGQRIFDTQPLGFDFEGGNYGNSEHSNIMIEGNPKNLPSGALQLHNERFIEFLELEAKGRGIEILDDKIESIQRDGDNIISLNKKYKADYFIDCSGFKSILNKSKFISYEDILVNDRALFFRTEVGKPRCYTKATTMNNGWLWEIDHKDTTGNGYVYSSKYTTDKEALKEVQEKLNIIIDDYKIIKFKTGRLDKHWVGNTISIGNADGFVEPLEASSLMLILNNALQVSHIISYDNKGDLIDRYNKHVNNTFDNVKDFVLIHFCFNTKKHNKYWKDYNKRIKYIREGTLSYELVEYYLKNNTHIKFLEHTVGLYNPYGIEGFWAILRGLIPDNKRKEWLELLNEAQ